MSWKESFVLGWAGLRGALSMVLALSLPEAFEHRAVLIHMTFGVVLLSILAQGLSMGRVLRKLGLVGLQSEDQQAWAQLKARAAAARAAMAELERVAQRDGMTPPTHEALRIELSARLQAAEFELRELLAAKKWLNEEELREWRKRLLHAERQATVEAQREGLLAEEGAVQLLTEIDGRLAVVEHAPVHPPSSEP